MILFFLPCPSSFPAPAVEELLERISYGNISRCFRFLTRRDRLKNALSFVKIRHGPILLIILNIAATVFR